MQTKNMLMTVSDLHQINEFSSLSLGNSYTELVTSVHWRLRSSTELAICFQSSSSSPSSLAPKRTSSWRTGFLAVEKKELRKLSYMSFTILNLQFLKYITPEELLYTCILCQKRKIYKYYIMPQKTYTMVLYHCVLYQLAGQLTCFETEGSFSFLRHLLDQVAKRKRPPASLWCFCSLSSHR